MKNVIITAIAAVVSGYVGYKIGTSEGKNFKEKATACGLSLAAKGKNLVNKVFPPKAEAPADAEE